MHTWKIPSHFTLAVFEPFELRRMPITTLSVTTAVLLLEIETRWTMVAQRVEWEDTPAGTVGEGKGQLEKAEEGHTEELGFQPRDPASGAT